jgi:hypothetical protein
MISTPEELSTRTLEELTVWEERIHASSKEIRHRLKAVVNLRLANEISQEEYASARQLAQAEAAECSRMHRELANELDRRRQLRRLEYLRNIRSL